MVLVVALTFLTIFDKSSLVVIKDNIFNLKIEYILLCVLIIISYFLIQGIYTKGILRTLNHKLPFKRGLYYAVTEFYFSGITPSSTGGQPAQFYEMTKDKIPMRKSYITLMLSTIYFKLILIVLGIVVLVFKKDVIFDSLLIYRICFFLGFTIDALVVVLYILLVFKQNLVKSIVKKILSLLSKLKYLGKYTEKFDIDNFVKRYNDEIQFIGSHKQMVFWNFILVFIQRLLLFSIAYVMYKAMGYNAYNYFDLLMIQVIAQISIEGVPIPGGAGISEGILHNMFVMIFASKLADVGMLLTRAFSFYIPVIGCGLIILINKIINRNK